MILFFLLPAGDAGLVYKGGLPLQCSPAPFKMRFLYLFSQSDSTDVKFPEGTSAETERRLLVARAWVRAGSEEGLLSAYGFSSEVMKLFWNWIVVMVTQHGGCTKYH